MSAGWRAVVRTPVAPMFAEPRAASVQVSQQLAGHVVLVTASDGDWVRARGSDGYEGWMHQGFLSRAPRASARQSLGARRISLGCRTRQSTGSGRTLPLGAYLGPEEIVDSGDTVIEISRAARFPRIAAAIVHTAQEYFVGTSYEWGGITPWGADCSGFVQTLFWLHGVPLPRDSAQQAEAGMASRRVLTALQSGELAFFSDREDHRITHVGLGIGGGRMAHVSIGRGGFAIERLSDGHDTYVRKLREQFRFVRQVL